MLTGCRTCKPSSISVKCGPEFSRRTALLSLLWSFDVSGICKLWTRLALENYSTRLICKHCTSLFRVQFPQGTFLLMRFQMVHWLTTRFLYLLCTSSLSTQPRLSTLPAVRHTTSWRKTGKYIRPVTSPKMLLISKSFDPEHKSFLKWKLLYFCYFAFRWGFPLDKCSPSLPRGSSKQRIARAKYIPSWIRMHAWNELFLSEQKIWILHLSSWSDKSNFTIVTANITEWGNLCLWDGSWQMFCPDLGAKIIYLGQ